MKGQDPRDLAAAFLEDTAGRRDSWPQLFAEWATRRGLSRELQRAVKVAVLRQTCFGAGHQPGGNAA